MADKTSYEFVNTVMQVQPVEITTEKYDHWDDYEKAMSRAAYSGPSLAAKEFEKLGLDKKARILEIGVGTGLLGKQLNAVGYKNLVGLDPSDILEKARSSGCYTEFIKDYVKKGHRLDIPKESFDAVMMCGVMAPGHIHVEDLIELIPVVKKGGLICWGSATNNFYAHIDSRHSEDFIQKSLKELVDAKLIRPYQKTLFLPGYYRGQDGAFCVFEVL